MSLSAHEVKQIKKHYANKWLDPVARIEDVFNIRRADGSLVPLKLPEPQKQMIRDGILGKNRDLVGSGISYVSVTNKGRQLGFSVALAAEQLLIAEDFPNTNIFYVATVTEQADDWMRKVQQMIDDANHWPAELGGRSMLNITNTKKVFDKIINDTHIIGLSANPSAIRGKTGISVVFDEAAWAIRERGIARETWKALKYLIRQGGSARIQSTPRLSDEEEFFWGLYKKGEAGSLAIHTYECPAIENWRDLDLEEPLYIDLNNQRRSKMGLSLLTDENIKDLLEKYKSRDNFIVKEGDSIQQDVHIPYWWVNIADLETDRASDLEQFRQENLGVPLDETYKLIKSEWIYSNANDGVEWNARPQGNTNRFILCCDFAQVRDLSAFTVVEEVLVPDRQAMYIERKIVETQADYPEQRDIIFDMHMAFRFSEIQLDFTGHGRVISQMLAEKLDNNSFSSRVLLKNNTFTMQSKEQMAIGFRNIVMPDPITGKSRYRWLHKEKHHQDAIRHCMRVEKEILPQGGVRYSGKMHGRDDHFWSKAQIALVEVPTGVPRAHSGKIRKKTAVDVTDRRSMGQKLIEDINRKRYQIDREEEEAREEILREKRKTFLHNRELNFARKALQNGVVICRTKHKPVKPIHCADRKNCSNPRCPGFKYVEEICARYGVTKDEL